MAARLVLIRHGAPRIEEGVPQRCWGLTETGLEACQALGAQLREFGSPAIWSSTERKALETARALELGLPIREEPALREHERASLGYMTKHQLEAGVERLFQSDDELVFGDETARSVIERMEGAIRAARRLARGRDVIAVTHGTAAALFVGRRCGLDGHALWRSLGAPAAMVLDGDRLLEVIA